MNKNEKYDHQYISIRNSIFSTNEAGDSGATIELEKNIMIITGDITNCYIFNNLAWRINFFFL